MTAETDVRCPVEAVLTTDELTALGDAMGGLGFPGVAGSVLDDLAQPARTAARDGLLAGLVLRGLCSGTGEELDVAPELAVLLVPLFEGERWVVERGDPEHGTRTSMVAVHGEVVVQHVALDAHTHHLAVVGVDGDPVAALLALVGASAGVPEQATEVRDVASGLLARRALQPALEGLRAMARVQRVRSLGGGVVHLERLGVVDGGPGQVWLVHPDPYADRDDLVDPPVLARRVAPEALEAVLARW